MKLWKTVLYVVVLVVCATSCVVHRNTQPQIKLTHVLAVTAEGDTLKLPIDVIRPIYNYNTYPTNRYPITPNYFYYSPHRYQPIYGQYSSRPSNNSNNTPIINQNPPAPRVDRITNPPATPPNSANNPRKN